MTESERETSRAIGSLESTVTHLTETWQKQDREATEGRRRMHQKIDELTSQQQALATTVKQQTDKIAEIEPAIKRFEAERQRREGANSLIKLAWGALAAFAYGLGYAGHEILQYFFPRGPH
jgi:septal ring factor EnvC (AmiA/AmiB activator)